LYIAFAISSYGIILNIFKFGGLHDELKGLK